MPVAGAALAAFDVVFEIAVRRGHGLQVVHRRVGQQRAAQVGVHDDPGGVDKGLQLAALRGVQDGLHLRQDGSRAHGQGGQGGFFGGLQNAAAGGLQCLADGVRHQVPRHPVLPELGLRRAQEVIDGRQPAQIRKVHVAHRFGRHGGILQARVGSECKGGHCSVSQGGTPPPDVPKRIENPLETTL